MQPIYKRMLLKLSGEALAGEQKFGLDYDVVLNICRSVKKCADMGVEIGIVVGGGNFWRGRSSGKMDRTRADHMGMLATAINALALADALEQLGVPVRVQTAISMQQVAEPYIRNRAVRHLEKGPCGDFRRRYGQSLLFRRPRRGAARGGNRCGHHHEGDQRGRRI